MIRSFQVDGDKDLADLETNIAGQELITGPLVNIAPIEGTVDIVTYKELEPDDPVVTPDRVIKLLVTNSAMPPAGRVTVCHGPIWVGGKLTPVLAHRKA